MITLNYLLSNSSQNQCFYQEKTLLKFPKGEELAHLFMSAPNTFLAKRHAYSILL